MSNNRQTAALNEMELRYKLVNWAKTMRVQTALVTALAVWVGYITVSPLNIRSTIILGAIGLYYHIFGFTMNEVEDYEYDASIGNGSEHPIARGRVHAGIAKYVAAGAAILSITISALSGYSIYGTLLLCVALIPAILYNKYSKKHWWSNIYLSMWAVLMVFAGALHAGTPNVITYLMALGIGIQIFVQVMEGSLKDMHGTENSMCQVLGAKLVSTSEYLSSRSEKDIEPLMYETDTDIITYSKKFIAVLYGSKAVELGVFIAVAYSFRTQVQDVMLQYTSIYFITSIIFITSLSMLTVYVYDRDKVKKMSSIHELSAILLIGLTVYPLDRYGGVFVALAPILWYIVVNQILHSGPLNPDV